jgi:hypothetical protein
MKYILFLIAILFLNYSDSKSQDNWQFDILGSNSKIEDFEIVDSNNNIIISAFLPPNDESYIIKMTLPDGEILWSKKFKHRISKVKTSPNGKYNKISFIEEYIPKQIFILNTDGEEIKEYTQKKVFFISDNILLISQDPEIAFEEFESKFDTKFHIEQILDSDNKYTFDLGGEIIDVIKLQSGIRLILYENMKLKLYQLNNISEDNFINTSLISENLNRDVFDARFINDSTLIFWKLYAPNSGASTWRINNSHIKQIPLEQRFISNLTLPEDLIYCFYYGGSAYFTNNIIDKIIGISFNEQIQNPLLLFEKFGGTNSKIELNNSAYFHKGNDKYFLKITENASKILIMNVK